MESDLYGQLAVGATSLTHRLWRNNIGVAKFQRKGQLYVVRFGIPGPGGSDMLGYTNVQITPDMVGQTLPVFTAAECKRKGKRAEDDQEKFLQHVRDCGGIAGTVTSLADYHRLIGHTE